GAGSGDLVGGGGDAGQVEGEGGASTGLEGGRAADQRDGDGARGQLHGVVVGIAEIEGERAHAAVGEGAAGAEELVGGSGTDLGAGAGDLVAGGGGGVIDDEAAAGADDTQRAADILDRAAAADSDGAGRSVADQERCAGGGGRDGEGGARRAPV